MRNDLRVNANGVLKYLKIIMASQFHKPQTSSHIQTVHSVGTAVL